MNERASYMLQVLETIGSPLLSAAIVRSGTGDAAKDAETLASLLTRSVKTGIDLSEGLDLSALGEDSDAIRLALTALAVPLVTSAFEKEGALPGDDNMKALQESLKPLTKFADNFQSGALYTQRLKDIQAGGEVTDSYQAHIQTLNAFVPAVLAATQHPAGQKPDVLISEVAGKITAKAADLCTDHFPGLDVDDQKRVQLGLVRALAGLYASCHTPQTGDTADKIWDAFELRVSVLNALTQTIVTGQSGATDTGSGSAESAGGPAASEAASPVSAETPPNAPPQTVQPPETPPQSAASSDSAPPGGANPMAMFAKKPAAEAGAPSAAPSETPSSAAPPSSSTSPAAQPAQPEEEKPADESSQSSGQNGSPMSFFAGKKEEGE